MFVVQDVAFVQLRSRPLRLSPTLVRYRKRVRQTRFGDGVKG